MEHNANSNCIIVKKVYPGTIAEEAGIDIGDILVEINGTKINDILEYRYLTNDEYITLLVRKPSGEEWEIEVEKDCQEDIGIDFDDHFVNSPKRCSNKCIFCFIDQLPKGMRETLYFKDDDSRLSFLQGNFVTLTNMKDDDIERIIKYHISPINVSVHTTNPQLRIKMLNNKMAGSLMDSLKKLTSAGIYINCQIVSCPGINDGSELERTLKDLFTMYPYIANVAIVPLGVTRYREGLEKLETYNSKTSSEIISLVERMQKEFQKKSGTPFARLADEFYIMADKAFPDASHYGDYEQLEDGIGMIRYFQQAVNDAIEHNCADLKGKKVGIITGAAAAGFIKEVLKPACKKFNVNIIVHSVKNVFFGEKITVAGLLTAKDIVNQLKDRIQEDIMLIPSSMLRAGEDVFLDDVTLIQLEDMLKTPIRVCSYTGDDIINMIIKEVE